jgi:hypothetical protein
MDFVAVVTILFVCAVLLGLSELTRALAPGYSLATAVAIPVILGLLLIIGLIAAVSK